MLPTPQPLPRTVKAPSTVRVAGAGGPSLDRPLRRIFHHERLTTFTKHDGQSSKLGLRLVIGNGAFKAPCRKQCSKSQSESTVGGLQVADLLSATPQPGAPS